MDIATDDRASGDDRRVRRGTALGLAIAGALGGLALGFSGVANADEGSSTGSDSSTSEGTTEGNGSTEQPPDRDSRAPADRDSRAPADRDSRAPARSGEDCPEPDGGSTAGGEPSSSAI